MNPEAISTAQALALVMADEKRQRMAQRFRTYYPDCTAACRNPRSAQKADHAALCRALYGRHLDFFRSGGIHRERMWLGANRIGKALRNATPVLTPRGWTPIETLTVGDEVVGGDGHPCYVTGVYPQGKRELVRMTFDDGAWVDCDLEHLWKCRQGQERYKAAREWHVRSTAEILKRGGALGDPQRVAEIPTAKCYLAEHRNLPVDPYVLGLLAGDGCYTSASTQVRFSTADAELVEAVRRCYPVRPRKGNAYDYGVAGGAVTELKLLGLWGSKSWQKTIPAEYLWNSAPARLQLLRGLMDTDGTAGKSGSATFYSTSPGLIESVVFLVRSLGGKATVSPKQTYFYQRGSKVAGRPSWAVRVLMRECPFALRRKAERWTRLTARGYERRLVSVEPIGADEATCIAVDSHDSTFVTKDFVVTHNTAGAAFEVTSHVTGLYPPWWKGRRFDTPNHWWVAGDTILTTRNILQVELLGPVDGMNTQRWAGMIPAELVVGRPTRRSGSVADCADTVRVRHVSGKTSTIQFMSYDQGRRAFQGTSRHGVWMDEEPPENEDIYGECLTRTLDVDGIVLMTFTPLRGFTKFLQDYCQTATFLERDGEQRPASEAFGVNVR